MAKLINGVWGAISGKLGNLIGVTRRGVTYLRTIGKPSKKPPTQKQIEQRARFKFLHESLYPFMPWISVGFHDPDSVRTALNAAFSTNYKKVLKGSYPNFEIDYTALMISNGPLANISNPIWEVRGADTLELSWTYPDLKFSQPDDQLMFVMYDPLLERAHGFIGGVWRSSGKCSIEIHPQMVGHALELYVSVSALDRKAVSDSLYLGRIVR